MESIAHHWLQKGIEEGRKKEKIIIARKLTKADLTFELISNLTGLRKKEIEKLK